MKKFYEFKQIENDDAELLVYGDITSLEWFESDVSGYSFAKELSEVKGDLKVRINSYGGEVSQGLAMYNLLKAFKGKVTTVCDGFACSAASVVFMAGDERVMPKSSLLMIHNAWSTAQGNASELRKTADDLDKITQPSVEIYKLETGLDEETIKTMMDDETWLSADEALNLNFATKLTDDVEAEQSIKNEYNQFMKNIALENKELKEALKQQDISCHEELNIKDVVKAVLEELNVETSIENITNGDEGDEEVTPEEIEETNEAEQAEEKELNSWNEFFKK